MTDLPLMNHPLEEPTAFRPEDLIEAVRQQRGKGNGSIPSLGVLEFDGDLIDKLIARDAVRRCAPSVRHVMSRPALSPTSPTPSTTTANRSTKARRTRTLRCWRPSPTSPCRDL